MTDESSASAPTPDAVPQTAPAAREPDPAAPQLDAFADTELGNAERLIALYGRDLRYCPAYKAWFVWDGIRWRLDEVGEAVRLVGATMRATMFRAAAVTDLERRKSLSKWALASESARRHDAVLQLARSLPGISVRPTDFDTDPWLLNVLNGTIDLRTGELRQHRREDLCAKLAPVAYDRDAKCPRFLTFLDEIFVKRKELIEFIQRAAGYSATGSTREEVVFVLHGKGRNGKTKLIEIMRYVLGDYAKATPFDTFLVKRDSGPRDDVADLVGARFVSASESPKGRTLDAAILKQLTGGDMVKARKLYGHLFEYQPSFAVWLATNHKPAVQDNSEGLWARIRVISFTRRFTKDEIDTELLTTLKAESAGILAWIVQGALTWQKDGLGFSEDVEKATADYRASEDHVGAFIAERCDLLPECSVQPSELASAYRAWCKESGVTPLDATAFNKDLTDRGFSQGRSNKARAWPGIGLKPPLFEGANRPSGEVTPPVDAPTAPPTTWHCTGCNSEVPAELRTCEVCDIAQRDGAAW